MGKRTEAAWGHPLVSKCMLGGRHIWWLLHQPHWVLGRLRGALETASSQAKMV